ncbi:MAG: HD-GYP domain-containing protein [Candidatus Omnitrophica bacterium]|nr:HD-GYP domain-containing protein [Candidatus Omnitrophota bacterium]
MGAYVRKRKKIDYQQALREVAKSMVRLKRPERLLKMITRFIDRELGLLHTSIVVLEEKRKRFIFVDSKGARRFPIRFVKFEMDHPLVQWFKMGRQSKPQDYLMRASLNKKLANGRYRLLVSEKRETYEKVKKAMDDLKVELAIPAYFKEMLIGFLLLGEKKDKSSFTDSEISFFQVLTQDCSMAVKNAEYHQGLIEKNRELEKRLKEIEAMQHKEHETYFQIMKALAQEIHAKDPYTFGHINQVERLGIMTAEEMGIDLSGRRRAVLSAGLILHDVGKVGIPDHILKKPSALTAEEKEIMKEHVDKGAKILSHLSDFKEVAEIVHCHHESFDGTGYPRGLKGEQIPIESRIVSVVDSFHAIVSKRCYSTGKPIEVAFEELERCSGTQFDPQVVTAFIRALKRTMAKRGVGFFKDDPTMSEFPDSKAS